MTNKSDSNKGLEAMLYVLCDESIDRDWFEAKLEDDHLLAEAVAEAVVLVQALKQSPEVSNALVASEPTLENRVVRSRQVPLLANGLVALATIAAAFCIIFFRWQRDTVIASAESLPEIAAAWIDLNEANSNSTDASISRFESDSDGYSDTEFLNSGLEYKHLAVADDMPDWILTAVTGTDSLTPEAFK